MTCGILNIGVPIIGCHGVHRGGRACECFGATRAATDAVAP